MSEFIDWLPPWGWFARSPGLSLLYSPLYSRLLAYSLALFPSLSLFLPCSKSLSISPSLLPVRFSRTPARMSTPFRLLPRPPPYPPNESAPTGALLASLSNPRVRLANTYTYVHIRSCSTFRNRQARCDSRNGRLLPSSSRATPSDGCIVCMCLAAVAVAAPTRETPTVGIVYRGIQRPLLLRSLTTSPGQASINLLA